MRSPESVVVRGGEPLRRDARPTSTTSDLGPSPGPVTPPMPRGVRTSPLGAREVAGAPYTLRVLQEGYCCPQPNGAFRADGSVTLVWGGPVTALVDTGGPWDRQRLVSLLAERGLSPDDVTHVVCTHGHSDHVGNINLFPAATLLVGHDLSRGDGCYLPHDLAKGCPYVLHPGRLEVVATPGHTIDHVSVVVRDTSLGTVVVAGDLFEREEDEEEWRASSEDPARQEQSRRRVMAVADVIVPGHGPPFRVFRERGDGKVPWEEDDEGNATAGGGPKGHGDIPRGDVTPGDVPEEEGNGTGNDPKP
ncbi:metallo-beta-lactamase domain-containing protein 1 isoform X2 [Aquila chrysaetos chrysaetos]|uniref:metallo-beta-lactamase domain-containing protein 1 isoform X2 n=1 Tax=Aquila chrysaetos chrysaetos TaxID=223781 RepID=UPI001176D0CC|nr:metallo-beta-lactamase domain-containing protein 1 isoform X2 [Aquila chrysaetos chrysaetos]